MTAQFFPDVEQILDILFDELPAGVYATDRANDPTTVSNSYSSSEIRTVAQLYANLYANLLLIYDDEFVSTVTLSGLAQWEIELFGAPQNAALGYTQRQNNLLTQIRSQGSISYPAIYAIVYSILNPLGLSFQIIQWNGCGDTPITGGWILDVSALDLDTYLASADPLLGAGRGVGIVPLDCSLNYIAAGITLEMLEGIQETAYTYEVDIFGNASAATLAQLDKILTAKEPARSTHVIVNNAPEAGWISPRSLDGGSFTGEPIDDFDAGAFDRPPGTYDPYDAGGF